MKKIIALLFSLFLLLALASCDQNTATPENTDSTTSEVMTEGHVNEQGGVTVGEDIINEDARFVYFYSKTCPHCQDLNEYLAENQMYDKVPLEKLELNENADNRQQFLELTTQLGNQGAGVPFVYDTVEEKYVVGTDKAIVLFEAYVSANETTNASEVDTTIDDEESEEIIEGDIIVEDEETSETTTAEVENESIEGNLVD